MLCHILPAYSSKSFQNNVMFKDIAVDKAGSQTEAARWGGHVLQCVAAFSLGLACHTAPVHLLLTDWRFSDPVDTITDPPSGTLPYFPNSCKAAYLDVSNRCQILQMAHIFTQIKAL